MIGIQNICELFLRLNAASLDARKVRDNALTGDYIQVTMTHISADAEVLWENCVNIMAADALAIYMTRSSAAMASST